jgi:hypothetical protein
VQTYRQQQGARAVRLALGAIANASVTQLLMAAAARYGIDPSLAMAVAQRESGLNPNAYNPKSGASGVMQLMPATAAALGVTNIWDAAQNVDAGVRYLGQLISQFGDVAEAVAAYDWGPGNVNKALNAYGSAWLNYAPQETKNYVQAILGVTPSTVPGSDYRSGPGNGTTAPGAIPGMDQTPLTIDNATGLPIDDSNPTPGIPSGVIPASVLPQTQPNILLLTALGVGAYLLADFLRD